MTFDPAAFENIDALKARDNREADRAQIDAKIASEWVDFEGAKNLMYWDLQARSPEEIEAAKNAEAREQNSQEDIINQLDSIDSLPWDFSSDTTLNSQPASSRSSESNLRERIARRSGVTIRNDTQTINENFESLDSTEQRLKNKEMAERLFFSQEHLAEQVELISRGDPKEKEKNSQWIESNLWEQWVLHDSFTRIQWSFVMPKWIQWNSLEEIYNTHPERIWEINAALSDAIELEVCAITDGKVNYDTLAVESLVIEIHDLQCPPLEKIQKFAEIHTKVHTSVARGWKSQSDAFKKKQALTAERSAQERTFQDMKAKEIEKNTSPNEVVEEVQKEEETQLSSWDVFEAGDGEIASSSSENVRESV